MPWLVRDGRVLASLEVARNGRDRRRGLLGRSSVDGALLLRGARRVHTVGMRFPIDVAHCDADMVVLDVTTLRRHRLGPRVPGTRAVIEAEAGSFASWGLRPGDHLAVAGAPDGAGDE